LAGELAARAANRMTKESSVKNLSGGD
jgi:hypothetical protein